MAFKFLEEWAEKYRAAFYAHVRSWIGVGAAACKAAGRRITWEEHTGLIELWDGANSYERRLLIPLLDDEGLCRHAEYCMGQASRELGELELPQHYNDAVEREIAPLLVKRLRVASAGWTRLDSHFEMVRAALEPAPEDEGLSLLDLAKKRAAQLRASRLDEASFAGAALTALEPAIGDPFKFMPEDSLGNRVLAGIEKVMGLLAGAKTLVVAQRSEAIGLCRQLQILQAKVGAEGAELDEARREAARWEVQAQDLRDKLVQVTGERDALKTEVGHLHVLVKHCDCPDNETPAKETP